MAVADELDLVARAKAVIPGGSSVAAVLPEGLEFVVERAEGATITTTDGRLLADFVCGGGALVLGHAHPAIGAALNRAFASGTHHYVLHRRTIELAERICRLVESAEAVRFTASGSEATMHALRLARAVTGRRGIVKFDGAYHGHHDLGVWSFEESPADGTRPVPESAGVQARHRRRHRDPPVQRPGGDRRPARRASRPLRRRHLRAAAARAAARARLPGGGAGGVRPHRHDPDLRRDRHGLPAGAGRRAGALRRRRPT